MKNRCNNKLKDFLFQLSLITFASLFSYGAMEWFFYSDSTDFFEQPSYTDMIIDSVSNGGISVVLFGNYKERHDFAKGRPTRFGKLPYSTETVLLNKGWSDEKVHRYGNMLGVSEYHPSRYKKSSR